MLTRVWFRRDLRDFGHAALYHALACASSMPRRDRRTYPAPIVVHAVQPAAAKLEGIDASRIRRAVLMRTCRSVIVHRLMVRQSVRGTTGHDPAFDGKSIYRLQVCRLAAVTVGRQPDMRLRSICRVCTQER